MGKFTKTLLVTLWILLLSINNCSGCKTSAWRNMTMEELLLKSDIVVYGEDIGHGKLRNPQELDARFMVYCVFKAGAYSGPGQVVIEDISGYDECAGVQLQTRFGENFIVGLTRTLNGFMKYAEINPLQKTAFEATNENFERIAAICDLDKWSPPKTGNQDKCPSASKPRFCTKVRDPTVSRGSDLTCSVFVHLISVLVLLTEIV